MVNKMSGVLVALFFLSVVTGDDDLASKCSAEFPKVAMCLPFATAKAATPTKECCTSVSDLRKTDPGCLCFVIQQVHNGTNPAIKNMGVQEARLLQLPSVCKVNGSISECPRLLHLSPNSPDAAIFTNNSTASPTTPVATPGTSSSSTANSGIRRKPSIGVSAIFALVTLFLAFSST